jgi:DNA-binding transcriptional ArsR family regulator
VKEGENGLIQEIAAGAWTRLRNLIGALDRVDRLETSDEFAGWLQGLAAVEPGMKKTIREFLLRALRLVSDPLNTRILMRLDSGEGASTTELSNATGLTRVELVERLNELARAGLTVQALEGELVEATPLARGFVSLVDEITEEIKRLASNDYLLNPRAQPPKPEPRVHIFKPR